MIEDMHEEISNLVCDYLKDQSDWLTCCFKKAKLVSDFRNSSEAYGFEWAPHTAFAYFLIQNQKVSELKIGQKSENGNKYDLRFRLNGYDIVIELKTVSKPEKINTQYVKSDIEKEFPEDSIPYLLVFSYPSDDNNTNNLDWKCQPKIDHL